jgi:Zn-dependent M28 family amino/carboxypeptidase
MRTLGAGCVVLLLASAARADVIADLVALVSRDRFVGHETALVGERATPVEQAAAADYIADQLAADGLVVTRDPVLDSENVIAALPGRGHPEQVFVVGAHFDSVAGSPGADDNASGVSALLELAQVLVGASFDATIEFVAFGLEEDGLVGSTHYAAQARYEGRDIIGMISLEMIAFTCPKCQFPFGNIDTCFAVSNEGVNAGTYIGAVANGTSAWMTDAFQSAAASYVPSLQTEWAVVAGDGSCLPDTRRSDHAPFWDRGYPAMMLTDTADYRNKHYHTATDTFATLDLDFATDVTRATLAMVGARAVPVPEPAAPLAGAAGLAALALTRRRRGAPRSRARSRR